MAHRPGDPNTKIYNVVNRNPATKALIVSGENGMINVSCTGIVDAEK